MQKIKITCDSTCDLTKELYEKYNVSVTPLCVTLGQALHRDGVDVCAEDIYAYVDQTGILPRTSAISVGEYEDFFRSFVDDGYAVVHINISSEFSACYQNACLAAQEVGNVYAVDSRNLSSGSGHLVIAAAELAQQGMDAAAIAAELNRMQARVDASFVLQTLEYLKKGGRCSSIVALGANLLSLRPEIVVTGGKMQVGRKYRGKMEKTILDYVKGRLAGRDDVQTNRIFITHSGVSQDIVDKVADLVQQLGPFQEVLITKAGCTITSHCGPNCLGVLFLKKEA